MRSFINWEILQRIENSPEKHIVQRKVSLINSFLFGYENIYLKLNEREFLENKYVEFPSLEDYARIKYNAENIGTRNFVSVISYFSEDERDLYCHYFGFLHEYETKFKIEENITWTLNEKPYFKVKTLLRAIRKRFPMYFGIYDLAEIRAFLDGYFLCKKDYKIPLDAFDIKIKMFTENIVCESLGMTGKFVTWDRKYRYERDWKPWGETENGKEIVEAFWTELEQFVDL